MCGIFGYIGNKQNAPQIVLEGLKRLDYRGYDSWGIAALNKGEIMVKKEVGKIGDIKKNAAITKINSRMSIGHTRWATNGAVTKQNAHPHFASDHSFVLAQNGIVENHDILRKHLREKGYAFVTDTDTEVIVRLIEEKRKTTSDLLTAVRKAFLALQGRNTIIVLSNNNEIIAARNGSPLVVGRNPQTNEYFVSSDTLSFSPFAKQVLVLENGQMIYLTDKLTVWTIKTGHRVPYQYEHLTLSDTFVDKEGFDHYMLKEIFDSPKAITALLAQDEKSYEDLAKRVKTARGVYTIGSGTAGIAAAQIAFYLRRFARINAVSLVGADAKEYFDLFTKDDILIAPSQSGETADVLEVLEIAQKRGVTIASLVNMPGSMMTRMSQYKFMSDAGPEICVMSTKVFTSQIVWGYLVAKTVQGRSEEARKNLTSLAHRMDQYLEDQAIHKTIRKIAHHLLPKKDIFLLGKYQNFQIIREGMVKLIEGSYKHAHAIPAGDLKHYAITLMEKGVPVIVVLSKDETKADVLNAVSQVRSRGAEVIGIAPTNEQFDYHIPILDTGETSDLLTTIPLQLLAYYLALALGNNIDKPRNIAKSVTVK